MKKNTSKSGLSVKPSDDYRSLAAVCLAAAGVLFIIWTFTGKWPWVGQYYNSYILQAQSWLDGRLDLGQNYSHLEIAVFEGKYYISFPPFPSYLMFPFVLIGWDTCDGFIAFVSAVAAAAYAYKILDHFGLKNDRAVFFSLLLTVGSNWLFTAQVAWVWFIAQNLAFTLSLMAIYYALKGKAGISLFLWACAVGCRPFNALYLPVLLYLLYKQHKEEYPDDGIKDIIKKRWKAVIPMAVIALSYMALNFARFGNPLEFGHNYLPEFTEAEDGQFNLSYMLDNIPALFRLPKISFDGAWEYQAFNGTCMFLVSPIFISCVVYGARYLLKADRSKRVLPLLILAMVVAELAVITAHKTMGGSQFGNRYTNDVLPMAFLGLAVTLPKDSKWDKFNYILFVIGLTLNAVGSVLYYTA